MWPEISARIEEKVKARPALVAAVSALSAVLFASGYLEKRENQMQKVNEPVSVVVAARDIAPGEVLDESSVRLVQVPLRFVQPAAFSKEVEAAGRISTSFLRAGTHVTPAVARKPSERRGVSPLVPAGRRAIAVFLNGDSAGRIVQPNDFVDVLATFDLGNDASTKRTTLSVVENVQVLAVGSEVADSFPSAPAKSAGAGIFGSVHPSPAQARGGVAIALAATPDEAQALAFAEASGKLAITVRPATDDGSRGEGRATTIATITGGYEELAQTKRGFREYKGK